MAAAQATHAAFHFAVENPDLTREWFEQSNYLVVLAVPDESSLIDLADRAIGRGVNVTLTREPDIGNQCTAFACLPGEHHSLFACLPLAGKVVATA